MTRAALYLRVSDQSQEGNHSLGTQEMDARAYCADKGYEVVGLYREVYSGVYLEARPELSRLRKDIEDGKLDVAVIWHSDRLSRDQDDRVYLRVEANRHGARYEFVRDPAGHTEEDRLVEYIRGYAAKLEWRRIRERSIANVRARVNSGKMIPGGWPLYGYRWRDGAKTGYIEDPATAWVVRRMFAEAAAGKPIRAIARGLTADGIPTPRSAKLWYPKRVWDTIRNPAYKGEGYAYVNSFTKQSDGTVKHSRRDPSEWVRLPEGTIPALVDDTTWTRANAGISDNIAEHNRPDYHPTDVLLRAGHVVCGHCGKRMCVKRLKDGAYYSCQTANRDPEGVCRYHSIRADELDNAVWQRVKWILSDPGIIEIEQAKQRHADHIAPEIEELGQAIQGIERQEANIAGAIAQGVEGRALDILLAKLDALGRERAAATRRRDELLTVRSIQTAEAHAIRDLIRELTEDSRDRGLVLEPVSTDAARDFIQQQTGLDETLEDLRTMEYDRRRERLTRLGVTAHVNRKDSGRARYEITMEIPYPDDAFQADPRSWDRTVAPYRGT